MKIIHRARQMGKTTEIIKIAADTFSYIVCLNHREADRIAKLAKEMKLDIPLPISFDEFKRNNYYFPGIKGFVFDNTDLFLQNLAYPVPVWAASFTDEDSTAGDGKEE